MRREGCRCSLLLIAAWLVASGVALADTYPSHTIRLIVPFPAGGSNDVAARLIAPHLEKAFGQSVIVDNRPAAGGIVGSDAVAKAAPDGHMLFTTAGTPPAVLERLNAEVNRIVRRPEVTERFGEQGVIPAGSTSEELRALVAGEIRQWTEIVRAADIKVE